MLRSACPPRASATTSNVAEADQHRRKAASHQAMHTGALSERSWTLGPVPDSDALAATVDNSTPPSTLLCSRVTG